MIAFRGADLPDEDLTALGKLHHAIIDLERIGDRAENIAEYAMELHDVKEKMTSQALAELKSISGKTKALLAKSLEVFNSREHTHIDEIESMKREIDIMQKDYTENHIQRLQSELCMPHTGIVYTNMLASLERIASHSVNIAQSVEV
jgi:phosphate:Na+ symporter